MIACCVTYGVSVPGNVLAIIGASLVISNCCQMQVSRAAFLTVQSIALGLSELQFTLCSQNIILNCLALPFTIGEGLPVESHCYFDVA